MNKETTHRLHLRNLILKGVTPTISIIPSPISADLRPFFPGHKHSQVSIILTTATAGKQ